MISWGRPGCRRGITFFIISVAFMVASCSAPQAAPQSPTTSSAASVGRSSPPAPATTSAEAAAAAAAVAAYRGFRAAQVKAEAVADVRGSGIERYAADKALAAVSSSVLYFRRSGIVVRGAPTLDPRAGEVTLSPVPRVVVEDCFDTTRWEAVFAKTGKSAVAPGQPRRTVVRATVEVVNGSWVVRDLSNERDRTC